MVMWRRICNSFGVLRASEPLIGELLVSIKRPNWMLLLLESKVTEACLDVGTDLFLQKMLVARLHKCAYSWFYLKSTIK